MIDRESAARRSNSKKNSTKNSAKNSYKAGYTRDNYDEPIGISKKLIVYLVILVLIAVLCFAYVIELKSARSSGSTANEAPVVSGTSSTAVTGETASEQEPAAEEAPEKSEEKEEASEEAAEGSGEEE